MLNNVVSVDIIDLLPTLLIIFVVFLWGCLLNCDVCLSIDTFISISIKKEVFVYFNGNHHNQLVPFAWEFPCFITENPASWEIPHSQTNQNNWSLELNWRMDVNLIWSFFSIYVDTLWFSIWLIYIIIYIYIFYNIELFPFAMDSSELFYSSSVTDCWILFATILC